MQEPFDQFAAAQFVVATTDAPWVAGLQDHVRLGGVYFDDVADVWRYKFDDLDVPSSSPDLRFHTTTGDAPSTPDSEFGPDTRSSYFTSAVFAYVGNNEPRIFCALHVAPDDEGDPVDQHAVQWHVINPDLNDFLTTGWAPSIVASGRLPGPSSGDAFHPVIGVTPQGVAYIEYTFSNGVTWPQIRRAQLTSNYTAVQSDTLVRAGPALSYTGPRWADFADMQSAPSGCGFWSLHTLVVDPSDSSTSVDARDVWLFENSIDCNDAEMTGDGIIDEADLLFFSNEYAAGSRRADMNRDRVIDVFDYNIYLEEYAKRSK